MSHHAAIKIHRPCACQVLSEILARRLSTKSFGSWKPRAVDAWLSQPSATFGRELRPSDQHRFQEEPCSAAEGSERALSGFALKPECQSSRIFAGHDSPSLAFIGNGKLPMAQRASSRGGSPFNPVQSSVFSKAKPVSPSFRPASSETNNDEGYGQNLEPPKVRSRLPMPLPPYEARIHIDHKESQAASSWHIDRHVENRNLWNLWQPVGGDANF